MSYSYQFTSKIEGDLRKITTYFKDKSGTTLTNDFLAATQDTLERITKELNQGIFRNRILNDIYYSPISADSKSKSFNKNFKKYYIWYELDQETERAIILLIDYYPKAIVNLEQIIKERLKEP